MANGFEVNHASLDQHSQDITTIMDQVSGASGDAGSLWDPKAFGIIGESWAGILSIWTDAADKAIKTAVEAGHKVSDDVKKMNENYKNNEDRIARNMNAIGNGTAGS
jgi:hypothetical protein